MGRFPDKGSGGESQDFGQLSRRQDAFRSAFAAAPFPIVTGDTPTQVVSIFDGGSKPVTVPQQFAAHPATVSGTESESGTYTAVVDTGRNMIVTVLGGVPAVGDLLLAFLIDGRWVAERGGGTGPVATESCAYCENLFMATMYLTTPLGMLAITRSGAVWSGSRTVSTTAVLLTGSGSPESCHATEGTYDVTIHYELICPVSLGANWTLRAFSDIVFWVGDGLSGFYFIADASDVYCTLTKGSAGGTCNMGTTCDVPLILSGTIPSWTRSGIPFTTLDSGAADITE